MALTFRTATSVGTSVSTYRTVAKPTGTAEGDLLFAQVARNTDTNQPSSVPEGWALVPGTTYRGNSTLSYYALYYKVAGASEPADYTWTWASGSYRIAIVINCCYGDFDPADIFDNVSDTLYSSNNTTIKAASFNVTNENSHLLHFPAFYSSDDKTLSVPTVPDDFTNITSYWSATPDFDISLNYLRWSGNGETGDIDSTLSSSVVAKHAFVVALNPAPEIEDFGGLSFGISFI